MGDNLPYAKHTAGVLPLLLQHTLLNPEGGNDHPTAGKTFTPG